MQSDFLPNFILCNTTQRFIRSSKAVPVQKPSIPSAKSSFYCGTQVSNPLTAIDDTITIIYEINYNILGFINAEKLVRKR